MDYGIKAKKVKEEIMLPVQVIISDRNSALVQYVKDGALIRATITRKNLENDQVKESVLNRATKFGIDWSEIKFPAINAAEINRLMRSHGLWTAQDVKLKPGAVSQVIMQACAPLVSTIFNFVKDK